MTTLRGVDHIAGRAIPLRGHDIDTDRIIPARYLKAVTFEGLETHVFEDDRTQLQERGQMHAFSNPGYQGATVLLVNGNFGCGSSREHAPQALQRWGIRAVIGESFSEIFFGNSVALGMPCLTVSAQDADALLSAAEADPNGQVLVSVAGQSVEMGGRRCPPARARHSPAGAGMPPARCSITSNRCGQSPLSCPTFRDSDSPGEPTTRNIFFVFLVDLRVLRGSRVFFLAITRFRCLQERSRRVGQLAFLVHQPDLPRQSHLWNLHGHQLTARNFRQRAATR